MHLCYDEQKFSSRSVAAGLCSYLGEAAVESFKLTLIMYQSRTAVFKRSAWGPSWLTLYITVQCPRQTSANRPGRDAAAEPLFVTPSARYRTRRHTTDCRNPPAPTAYSGVRRSRESAGSSRCSAGATKCIASQGGSGERGRKDMVGSIGRQAWQAAQ